MDWINGAGWSGVLIICLGLYRVANGQLSKKVNRDTCHVAQEGIKGRIDNLEKHVDTRFDDVNRYADKRMQDLKDFLKNGD